jgi:hypothetical protein
MEIKSNSTKPLERGKIMTTVEELVRKAVQGLEEEGDILETLRESKAFQECIDELIRTDESVRKAIAETIANYFNQVDDSDFEEAIGDAISAEKIEARVGELLEGDPEVRKVLADFISGRLQDSEILEELVTDEDISAGINSETINAKVKAALEDESVQETFGNVITSLMTNEEILGRALGKSREFQKTVEQTILDDPTAKEALTSSIKKAISEGRLDRVIAQSLAQVDLSSIVTEVMNEQATINLLRARIQSLAEKEIRSIRINNTSLEEMIQAALIAGLQIDSNFKRKITQAGDEALRSGRIDRLIQSTLQSVVSEEEGEELTKFIREVTIKVVSETILGGLKPKI